MAAYTVRGIHEIIVWLAAYGRGSLSIPMDRGLFAQTRVDRDGKAFTMRNGRSDTREDHGVLFKMRRDPRTTRVGRSLRRTLLEEWAQLANVVVGDSSLVDPLPVLPLEIVRDDAVAARALVVPPEVAGPWQVNDRSAQRLGAPGRYRPPLHRQLPPRRRPADRRLAGLRTVGALVGAGRAS